MCFVIENHQKKATLKQPLLIMLFLQETNKTMGILPSLNTQSCIRGLLVVRDFCFWAV